MDSIQTTPILHQASILDDAHHIVEVTIIKPGPAQVTVNGDQVCYTEEALQASLPLWEGAACFCDHFNKSVRNIAGVFFAPWYEEGVKAKLRFIDLMGLPDAERLIDAQLEVCQSTLDDWNRQTSESRAGHGDPFFELVYDFRRMQAELIIEWLNHCKTRIQEGLAS